MSAARDRTIASQDDGIDRELVVRPGAGLITSCMPPSQRSIERPTVERQEDGQRRAENALPPSFTVLQRGQEAGEYGEQHRAIVEALRDRDAEVARELLTNHLRQIRENLFGR
jgi:FCD domain